MDTLSPVTLTGDLVELRPLDASHHDALVAAATDGELWRLPYTRVPDAAGMAAEIDRRLELRRSGQMLPFTAVRRADDSVIGMTTFCNLAPADRRAEIGYTWNARSAQRTGTNTEAKLLMLAHAFDVWGCVRVELRTDGRNLQSQAAIERLGAHRDGVLRRHTVMPDGFVRDTVVYSVLDHEWPDVRARLRGFLDTARAR